MIRDGFIFYRSFYESIKELPRDIQGDVLTAIMEYGLNGETTDNLKPVAKAIFSLIKPQLDANNKRFENGKKGGKPKQNETENKPNHNQTETKAEPKEKDNVKEKVKVNDKDSIEIRKANFKTQVLEFKNDFDVNLLKEFFEYWSESKPGGTKMRYEMEKTFEIELRLQRWKLNQSKFSKQENVIQISKGIDYEKYQKV